MLSFFEQLVFWHWLLFAALLLIADVITGSGFLFWTGISAALMGATVWFFPEISWTTQLLSFAILALLTAICWWLYLKRHPIKTDKPTLNRRGEQYIGRIFTLDTEVINGMGTIRVDDSSWRIRCKDLPAGSRVRIIDVDGVILLAEPFTENS